MDLRFLKTLHLVAQVGSMAQAARQLEISPAAVVHQLKALEKDVGAKLIVRSGRSVTPTDAGYRLLNSTRRPLAQLEEARVTVHGSAMTGELRLGSINSALHSLLPDILARYAADFPDVQLHVHANVSPTLFQQLQEDVIDLAICQHPPFELPKTFHWIQLREEPLTVLVHNDLAQHPIEDLLRTQPFIRYDRKLAGGRQADSYLRNRGIAVHDTCELDSLLAIALMIHQRQGVSLVPRFESLLIAGLQITPLALPDAPVARSFGLLWKIASPKGALIAALPRYARPDHD
ncbi:LysR family transcriptional regulator [Pusillimonas sp. MFBS29]|uniref:LysR substrate-binding domain-containing protein n=1 Tax=Pusillimonas sp. MFBS29 TaxID=2886690 RepID=UPI001D124BA3|nr:LysR family transcriptional regulator [Pusillimonas sp. MFBS29]